MIIPANMGISFNSPLAKSETVTVVISAIIARIQLLLAIFTPVPANDRPMSIITGPTTMGGNRLVMKFTPRRRTSALITPYTAPTATRPQSVPESP